MKCPKCGSANTRYGVMPNQYDECIDCKHLWHRQKIKRKRTKGKTMVEPWTDEQKQQFVEYYKQLVALSIKPRAVDFQRHFYISYNRAWTVLEYAKNITAKEQSK